MRATVRHGAKAGRIDANLVRCLDQRATIGRVEMCDSVFQFQVVDLPVGRHHDRRPIIAAIANIFVLRPWQRDARRRPRTCDFVGQGRGGELWNRWSHFGHRGHAIGAGRAGGHRRGWRESLRVQIRPARTERERYEADARDARSADFVRAQRIVDQGGRSFLYGLFPSRGGREANLGFPGRAQRDGWWLFVRRDFLGGWCWDRLDKWLQRQTSRQGNERWTVSEELGIRARSCVGHATSQTQDGHRPP